jgi:hypothetical protein
MQTAASAEDALTPETCAFYRHVLDALEAAGVPCLVGGAYAMSRHVGIDRDTKDFDLFVRPADQERMLGVLRSAGYQTEVVFPHWLGKAHCGGDVIDLIWSSGNGIAEVDDAWFTHAVEDDVFGRRVRLCPVEESIWSKAFIMERERYDGADILHLLRARAGRLDWPRLLRRFGPHWRVLLSHLILFGFVYPGERGAVPRWVLDRLLTALRHEGSTPPPS